MSNDAYVRLSVHGARNFGQSEHHDGLVFVDAPERADLSQLRNLPFSLFQMARVLLVRADWPVDSPLHGQAPVRGPRVRELGEQVTSLGLNIRSGLLHQPVGEPAWIEGDVDREDWPDLMARARAIELEGLLHWGQAVWKPSTYHYRLPSGEHAAAFVRVADAISCPRDAEVLASWVHGELRDGVGLLIDTGTLSALIGALVAAIRSKARWRPGSVTVLDGYPATSYDVAKAVRDTDTGAGVIALLSVNSSGRVRDHLVSALAALGGSDDGSLHVLLDKHVLAEHVTRLGDTQVTTWHPRPSATPLVRYNAEGADVCDLCATAATATLIAISPKSFDGSQPASLSRITPSVIDASENRRFWELVDRIAIRLGADPLPETASARPPGPMPIVIDTRVLLGRPDYVEAAARAFETKLVRRRSTLRGADLILVPQHEYDTGGLRDLVDGMSHRFGSGAPVRPFPPRHLWPEELRAEVRAASQSIVILTAGAVTGTTLQNGLAAVQSARDPGGYDLFGLVVHARLSEQRAWQTLENSYGGLLYAAWETYLPWRSPLEEERETLGGLSERVTSELSGEAQAFLTARTAALSANEIPAWLFWGGYEKSRLSPNSLFGESLSGTTVYVAVASAMERARKEQRMLATPARRVFEMAAIARSYYDPLILSAVLRWLQPHEAWWGLELQSEAQAVHEIVARAQSATDHLRILLPELLLAAAQGKLNRAGIRVLQAHAHARLSEPGLDPGERAPLELGLALLPRFTTADGERVENGGAEMAVRAATSAGDLLALVPGLLRDIAGGKLNAKLLTTLEAKVSELVG